jgi:hypothetical protein
MAAEAVDELRELSHRPTDRPARAGRVLDQEPRRVGAVRERLFEGGHRALEAGLEACPEVGAHVEHDPVRLDRATSTVFTSAATDFS